MTAVFITVYRQRTLPKINEERSVQGKKNQIIPKYKGPQQQISKFQWHATIFYTFIDQPKSIYINALLSAKWKIAQVWSKFGNFFAFGFIDENCLNKLSMLLKDLMSYTVRN